MQRCNALRNHAALASPRRFQPGPHRRTGLDGEALTRAVPEQRDALRSETPRLNPAGVPRTKLQSNFARCNLSTF